MPPQQVEVIEHLDQPRLTAFERVLFEFAKPATVVLTTPNVEYNARFETLPAGKTTTQGPSFRMDARAVQRLVGWNRTAARL
jgi:hypothetical protein